MIELTLTVMVVHIIEGDEFDIIGEHVVDIDIGKSDYLPDGIASPESIRLYFCNRFGKGDLLQR